MKRFYARLAGLGTLALLAVTLPGCNTVAGGGYVLSATGAGKATFGFYLECDGNTGTVSGDMVYIDHPLGLKAHLDPTESALIVGGRSQCGGTSGNGDFYGNYTPSPPTNKDGSLRAGGRFHVVIHDGGEPGPSSGDTISVSFPTGEFAGYSNSRPLLGGNVDRVE